MIHSTQGQPASAGQSKTYGGALAIVTTVFFMWGFVTVLNDILVPHLKAIFALNYTQIMFIQFTFFSAYFIFSMPAAKIISKLGYQNSIVLGLAIMGLGALVFLPAASLPSYGVFLTALYILATGMTILQVAANPYVAELGPVDKASSRLNLAQAFNSLGTTIGPFLGGILILSAAHGNVNPENRTLEASTVKLPYLGIAILLFLLAFAISRFHLPVITSIDEAATHESAHDSIWHYMHLILGAIAIFVYVGAEVSIGSFLVNYFSQKDISGFTAREASGYVSFYWGGAMIGRFIGSALLQKLNSGLVLGCAAIAACTLVVASMLTTGHVAMWTIILVGLFNSVMFPTIFTLGIDGLGKVTGKGSGLLVMAIVGGAILPVIQGMLADTIGIHRAFFLPALCYLYILYYGFRGSRHKPTQAQLAEQTAVS
jgi:MFS transporter, FHS family, L-fucose permease